MENSEPMKRKLCPTCGSDRGSVPEDSAGSKKAKTSSPAKTTPSVSFEESKSVLVNFGAPDRPSYALGTVLKVHTFDLDDSDNLEGTHDIGDALEDDDYDGPYYYCTWPGYTYSHNQWIAGSRLLRDTGNNRNQFKVTDRYGDPLDSNEEDDSDKSEKDSDEEEGDDDDE